MRTSSLVLFSTLVLTAQESPNPPGPAPTGVTIPLTAAAQATQPVETSGAKTAMKQMPKLDEGLLDPAWFGESITFSKGDDIDFFFMKPDFSLKDRIIGFDPWPKPVMLRSGRSAKDEDRALALSRTIPDYLREDFSKALSGKAKVGFGNREDLVVMGRVVDANQPNGLTKFMFGAYAGQNNLDHVTFDLKMLDPKTGEILLAIHHRAVRVNTLGKLETKLRRWSGAFATQIASKLAP